MPRRSSGGTRGRAARGSRSRPPRRGSSGSPRRSPPWRHATQRGFKHPTSASATRLVGRSLEVHSCVKDGGDRSPKSRSVLMNHGTEPHAPPAPHSHQPHRGRARHRPRRGRWGRWAVDRFLVEHVEIADVSAYEAENRRAPPTTADATEPHPTPTTDDRGRPSPTRRTPTATTSVTVSQVVDRIGRRHRDVLRRRRRARRCHRPALGLREGPVRREHHRDDELDRRRERRDLRDQRRLLRLPRHRHRDPQRRRLPRRGRARGLVFYTDGTVEVYDETTTTADELLADGAWNTLSFGPAIVEDGADRRRHRGRRDRHELRQPLDPGRAAAHRRRRHRREPPRVRRRRRSRRGLQPGRDADRARRTS